MKFSIIIPVYNVEKYLRECLDSVANQTFTDYEVICVNDGSTDGSLNILNEYAEKYPHFKVINKENGGTAEARNVAIREALGDYIWFVDSDDWIEKNSLETLSNNIKENIDILCFNGKLFFEENKTEKTDKGFIDSNLTGWNYYNKYALKPYNFSFVCVVLRIYKREFLLQNDLSFEKEITHEDNLWVPQVLYFAQKINIIDDCLYIYRIRSGSKMQEQSTERKKDILKVANTLSSFFIQKTDIDKTIIYRAITHHYQVAFSKNTSKEDKELLQIMNWENYHAVSRTKLRHKVLYLAMRISPSFFRFVIKHI